MLPVRNQEKEQMKYKKMKDKEPSKFLSDPAKLLKKGF